MIVSLLLRPPTFLRARPFRFRHDRIYTHSRPDRESELGRVRIGNIDVPLGRPSKPHLVPTNYLPEKPSTQMLLDLQWMMTKDVLAQDMLLVGPPGAGSLYRRRLVLAYAELTRREVQVVTLSSDTTESDLKQRRELVQNENGSSQVQFVDQAPVEAAIHGRLLLLDGLERAERNVLPTLNNLLENREMNLEDGRFLISPRRQEELLRAGRHNNNYNEDNDSHPSSSLHLVPVHPDFRVIALAMPPIFATVNNQSAANTTLDPPLRSRFQIRRIELPTAGDMYQELLLQQETHHIAADAASNRDDFDEIARICSKVAGSIDVAATNDLSSTSSRTRYFPSNALSSTVQIMTHFPEEDRRDLLRRVYPVAAANSHNESHPTRGKNPPRRHHDADTSSQNAFELSTRDVMTKPQRGIVPRERSLSSYRVASITRVSTQTANVTFVCPPNRNPTPTSLLADPSSNTVTMEVPCGTRDVDQPYPTFVHTVGTDAVLTAMVQDHAVGRDVLLLSPKGEGKNAIANQFGALLGYNLNLFHMYHEMTSRDLFLRRGTDPDTGDTRWEESVLVQAARLGELCVLDGVEKLRPDVLATLHGFINDRDTYLPDNRRLVGERHVHHNVFVDQDSKHIVKVHPSFRIIALGSVSRQDSATASWLSDDVMSMFSTSIVPEPDEDSLRVILKSVLPTCSDETILQVLRLRELLTGDIASDCGVSRLSTRDLIRVVKRLASTNLYDAICSVLVAELLPKTKRSSLDSLLSAVGIHRVDKGMEFNNEAMSIVVDEDTLTIGSFTMERGSTSRHEMIPSPPDFVDINHHVRLLRNLLQDYANGERSFLLLGNQGVGKNVVIDRMCQLARFEREYIQLHRDSTISQLTLTPSLEDGKIIWNDSPLVRAVTEGRALVIDEADKAPVEVISVLKGLVEDGELSLADGRRISRHTHGPGIIALHPNFSLFVLANRPGFPFLGNDFFREIGDCFSTRVIPNPDINSEIELLKAYAPGIEKSTLRRIAAAFADLRELCDNGDIVYPYSTREAVAVVKHLSRFPNQDLASILHNILDFDSFDERTYSTLCQVFERNDINVSGYRKTARLGLAQGDATGGLAIEYLEPRGEDGTSNSPPPLSDPKYGKWDENNEAHVGGNQWAGGTGGSDTAGLGGRGGPYRLDRGHKVHQVSDEAKAQVSAEAAAAARTMAEKALAERLNEINMTTSEWGAYNRFMDPIRSDVSTLRSMLSSMELKRSERGWLKCQSHGELDDSKLVDGIAGDKFVYKRRGTSQDGGPLQRPKRLRFVMDCSGSMYRFNGYDDRLFRCLEAALLIMKSFDGMHNRFDYSIVAHSGDSKCIRLVDFGKPPQDEKDCMKILQAMVAHSQFCRSGDNTLEALDQAIRDVANETGEESTSNDSIVVLVSDANLSRYGIHPRELGHIIRAGSDKPNSVKAYCIFIASFGKEAEEIKNALPLGRGHTCLQTSDLPRIVRDLIANVN